MVFENKPELSNYNLAATASSLYQMKSLQIESKDPNDRKFKTLNIVANIYIIAGNFGGYV